MSISRIVRSEPPKLRKNRSTRELTTKTEAWLQELLYAHPELLPVDEFDDAYAPAIPIGREVRTDRGPIDNLYVSPEGGIRVWYHEANEPQQMRPQKGEAPVDTFSIEVHDQIAQQFSREYIEAVVDDALQILPSYKDRQDSLVVINPRRVAVILDKRAKRGAVLPLDLLEQVIEGAVKMKLEKWLSNPPSPFYVMHIAGSWFGTRNKET